LLKFNFFLGRGTRQPFIYPANLNYPNNAYPAYSSYPNYPNYPNYSNYLNRSSGFNYSTDPNYQWQSFQVAPPKYDELLINTNSLHVNNAMPPINLPGSKFGDLNDNNVNFNSNVEKKL
jgi:hypothetical protein